MTTSIGRLCGTAIATTAVAGVLALSGTAHAGHDHYIVTPNGKCHQVARGQTAIDDPEHGGRHRYHDNVHAGATGGTTGEPHELGDGHARVVVYKDSCSAP